MSKQNECCILDNVRKEAVRIILERIQGMNIKSKKGSFEPEKDSPKAVYEVEEILNNPYMNRDEVPLAMDIFKPVVPEETELPVIVVIHGGALVLGDRGISRKYARALARRGYLVFSIEYRLAPRANVCEQLDDVCAGMDLVGRRLVDFNVDFTRIFLSAESAGAYLATYVAAMKKSKKLQEAIGYEPTRMVFKALGLHCGMYYTDRNDPIGWMLADQYYGEKRTDENFRQYLNPEHEEIIRNLPPVFLTTSRGDFLNNYTRMFHDALKKAGKKTRLAYYGDDSLGHAFAVMESHRADSIDAIDRMCDWFEEMAVEAAADQERQREEEAAWEGIRGQLESGQIIEQKCWKFIKEMNSFSEDRLNKTAIVDGKREYSYRQMFRFWDRYAEVFSAMGITDDSHSRVAMTGSPSVENIAAIYALNMTGASVSLIHANDLRDPDRWKALVEKEGITDLIVTGDKVKSSLIERIVREKSETGLRYLIVLSDFSNKDYACGSRLDKPLDSFLKEKNYSDVFMMEDLLVKYEAYPIHYARNENEEAALITHSSGTVSGIHKPVPLSDRAVNEGAARLCRDDRFQVMKGRAVSCLFLDLALAYAVVDMMHLPFAFGGKIVVVPANYQDLNMMRTFVQNRANIMFTVPFVMEKVMRAPVSFDLSSLEFVFMGAGYVSPDAKKRYDKYLERSGSKTKVTIGYGLSEVGGACILSAPEREDACIGYPLSGVKAKIFVEEEQKYYDLSDGPRTGGLFLSTPSLSGGRIDDRVFFELTEIEGEPYLDTHDLVDVNEDGSISYVGRTNKYFVNNDGVRFDAGLIETAVSGQPGIEACGMAPIYDKVSQDTVPVLYVKTAGSGKNESRRIVKKALYNVFIEDDRIRETNMPDQCMITDYIPCNESGKVDVHKILTGEIDGTNYKVVPVYQGEKLHDIRLDFSETSPGMARRYLKTLNQ